MSCYYSIDDANNSDREILYVLMKCLNENVNDKDDNDNVVIEKSQLK